MTVLTGIRIRRAVSRDNATLLEVWERSVRATHDFLSEADIVALRPLVAEELQRAEIEWWVAASADDAPIGFLGYTSDTVEALFLDPGHRGAGVGTALIAHAQQLSGGTLSVDVNEQNRAALGFYETLGFVVFASSPTDGAGRPFPLLHMRRPPVAVSPNA